MNKIVDYDIVGKNLKRVMKEKGVYGYELTKKVGCGASVLTDIIHGHHFPRISTLIEFASVLDVDIREFFKPYEEEPTANEVTKLFYGMTPSMQKAIVEIMKVSQEGKE